MRTPIIEERLNLTNNDSKVRGIYKEKDGTFYAMTYHYGKSFKTLKGAEKWFKKMTSK